MEKLGSLINEMLAKPRLKRKIRLGEIWINWEKIAGQEFAERTRPVKVTGRRLYVEVDSSALHHRLSFKKGELLDRVRAFTGGTFVEEIVFHTRSTKPKPPMS